MGDALACREPCVEQDGPVWAHGHTGLSESPACPVCGSVVLFPAGLLMVCTAMVCGRASAAAFLPQKQLGASFHSSCSKIIDSNVVSLRNLPRSCAQGRLGSEATEGCSQPHRSVQKCRFQAQPHAQEWWGGIFTTLPKWDSRPNPTPPSLPWLQPPPNRQQSCPCSLARGGLAHALLLPQLSRTARPCPG